MREFVVRSGAVASRGHLVSVFNEGLFRFAGGEWRGNLDAFHDLLSWPDDDSYRLVLSGWSACRAALAGERTWDGKPLLDVLEEIIRDNPQVEAIYG
jgi:hypothetical protein